MNDDKKELVMYSRTFGCPFVTVAKTVLDDYDVAYREVFIDRDDSALERVVEWTGFRSVPTLIVANQGEDVPYTDFDSLPEGESPRGIDRGVMITEPNMTEFVAWLTKHGFIVSQEA
jgi:glutaredoxin